MMENNLEFIYIGKSKNLIRPTNSKASDVKKYTPKAYSKLIPKALLTLEANLSLKELPEESKPIPLKSFSESDYKKAIEIIRDMIIGEQKLSDYEEALLCLTLFEMQAGSENQIAGFFDMLIDCDPNRARSFRRHLIEEILIYFPDKPVAKIITEALAREWKFSQRQNQKQITKQSEGSIEQLTNFNKSFFKWNNIFKTLKRKKDNDVNNSRFKSLQNIKEAYLAHSMLYMLSGQESLDNDFRLELGNIYYQFKQENKLIFDLIENNDLSDPDTEEVLFFLKCSLLCLIISEVLITYINILKLEGPSAQSLCPNKKSFILSHLKRYQETLVANNVSNNTILKHITNFNFNIRNLIEVTYNRNDCIVKYKDSICNKPVTFNFVGKTDNITALKISKEG